MFCTGYIFVGGCVWLGGWDEALRDVSFKALAFSALGGYGLQGIGGVLWLHLSIVGFDC